MLRITESESTAAAQNYFGKALSRGDYYFEGQEIAGRWHGKLAGIIGLEGKVEGEAFEKLLANKLPTGKPLTARTVPNRRPGYDFTFDVPKSVSVAYAVGGDTRLEEAMRATVEETMADIEEEMHARVRKSGAFHERQTGNFVWADFTHLTSRPAPLTTEEQEQLVRQNPWLKLHVAQNGQLHLPDPHLHVHAYVINATYDGVEKMYKAGDFMRQKRDATFFQAVYHSRLAARLQKLGYEITATAKGFELAGIDRKTVELFSRRTREIEKKARELGISDAEAKAALGAKTRGKKDSSLSMTELRRAWASMMTTQQREGVSRVVSAARAKVNAKAIDDRSAAAESINYALKTEFERRSEISERRLLASAIDHGIGKVSLDGVYEALKQNKWAIRASLDGERRVTTYDVLLEESELLKLVRESRSSVVALKYGDFQFRHPLFQNETPETKEQRQAIVKLFKNEDFVFGLVGRAGTGKTTVLKEVEKALWHEGKGLVIVAPTAEAAHGVLKTEGFKDVSTVKGLLIDRNAQERLRGAVLWVDEAGMLGNADMLELLKLAQKQGAAKVVLAGDPTQIRSVARGDALRFLQKDAGLEVAYLDKIRRQKDWQLRKAVEAFSRGDASEGINILDKARSVIEATKKPHEVALAERYAEEVKVRWRPSDTILVISPTHTEAERVTKAIRTELKRSKILQGKEHVITRTVNLALTEAERGNASKYEEGMVVQFKQNVGGYQRGERVKVLAVSAKRNEVEVATNRGVKAKLPLERSAHFQVYRTEEIKVSVGDKLRITENGFTVNKSQRLNNGALVTVNSFTEEGDIVIGEGHVLPRSYGNVSHGYVLTADSAQAKTVDRVLISVGRDAMSATDLRRTYVAVSRGRYEATIFTDDKAALVKAASRQTERRTATDLLGQDNAERFMREHLHREITRAQEREHLERLQRMEHRPRHTMRI